MKLREYRISFCIDEEVVSGMQDHEVEKKAQEVDDAAYELSIAASLRDHALALLRSRADCQDVQVQVDIED